MKSVRRQTGKEAHTVEATASEGLRPAIEDTRNRKRKKLLDKNRNQCQKSEGGSKSVLSKEDFKVLPSGTSILLGEKLADGRNCCSGTTVGTLTELQHIQPSEKIKLQLFPINESTRLRLEKDGYNPFLELTLSTKKRIWSVIKHINTKWGNENGMLGEVLLFPYDINVENIASYRRWSSEDTEISAAEIYMSLKCPAVFRLRYGWFSDHELKSFNMPLSSTYCDTRRQYDATIPDIDIEVNQMKESKMEDKDVKNVLTTDEASLLKQQIPSVEQVESVGNQVKVDDIHAQLVPWEDSLTNISIGGLLTEVSLLGKIINHDTKSESQIQPFLATLQGETHGCSLNAPPTQEYKMVRAKGNDNSQSQFLWGDVTTSLSIGGLLSEASMQGKMYNFASGVSENNKSSLPISSSTTADSFDAFVAAKLNSHPPVSKLTSNESRSSIFDAEDTCHAFPARKVSPFVSEMSNSRECHEGLNSKTEATAEDVQKCRANSLPRSREILDEDICSLGLKGIKWNDSLGPFDLGQPMQLPLTLGNSISASQFVK
ncbi:unnamed protein product [Cuscuta epithymum]|uniref:TSL-kinase interacting protein 1 n=1 Tax=Cuscuta epithymum TaxID=186058 RepID=A0AAV0FV59_9ASTE|nr:unnamed protein product [Cuscuta epithymum]